MRRTRVFRPVNLSTTRIDDSALSPGIKGPVSIDLEDAKLYDDLDLSQTRLAAHLQAEDLKLAKDLKSNFNPA